MPPTLPRAPRSTFLSLLALCLAIAPTSRAAPSGSSGPARWEPAAIPGVPAGTGCAPAWQPTFGGAPGIAGEVEDLLVFDDGTGPELYAAGQFFAAGATAARGIAKWDGASWSDVGGHVTGSSSCNAMVIFDDGSGPALYAGLSGVSRWDGAQWTSTGLVGSVEAMAVFDDGTGPALYVGGQSGYTWPGGSASRIARFDGTSWSGLGSGLNGSVWALTVFDDGSGPSLYAGGAFTTAGGASANRIAKWDGTLWSALGSGVTTTLRALAVFDDGNGPALYAGATFNFNAGGQPMNGGIARWDGTTWSALPPGANGATTLGTIDDGSGPVLYVSGGYTAGIGYLRRWDGSAWSGVGTTESPFTAALCFFDDGNGPALFVTGTVPGGHLPISKWNGSQWLPLVTSGTHDDVEALHAFDDGRGTALYAGGWFSRIGGQQIARIARWDGTAWTALGAGSSSPVYALTDFDDGTGRALYAGGSFTDASGQPTTHVARWDGMNWSSAGTGGTPSAIRAFAVFDAGQGPELYTGGSPSTSGATTFGPVAKWDGNAWTNVSSGFAGWPTFQPEVLDMAVFDDGTGTALYVCGWFASVGGVTVRNLAKWNGTSWSAVGGGVFTPGGGERCYVLETFDDGTGLALYLGGTFTHVGAGIPMPSLAKWDGTSFSSITGSTAPWNVRALEALDDGSGPSLFVSASWGTNGAPWGTPVEQYAAKWDGTTWSPLGSGLQSFAFDIESFDAGDGPLAVYGGEFTPAYDSGDSHIALWGNPAGCGRPATPLCDPGVGGVLACPCANPPAGPGLGCDNSSSTGGASLEATGIARLAFDTVRFTTQGEKPTATSVVLQGTSSSPTGVVFGQGVRCVSGTLKRLYLEVAQGGSITAPEAGQPSVSARSAELGDPIVPGTTRSYGVYYRDPTVLGGCPATSTFNVTNQLQILWAP